MKSLDDKFCVTMIVGEDDRLSYTLPALNFQPVFHQVLEDCIDGIFIKDITEYLVVGYIPMVLLRVQVESLTGLLILPYGFHLLLFRLGQIAVLDSFFQDERTALEAVIVDEVSVRYGILKLVGIVWLSLLHLKDIVSALVHLITRSGRKSKHQCVEVVEDGSILAEDASMSLVNNNQVKPTDRERLVLSVDVVNHCLIG